MTERPDSTKYKGDGSTSDFITDTDDYIDKIERELAEARAEIERLKCCGNCEYCNQKIEACEHPENEPWDIMKGRCSHWQHDAETVERGE